MRPLQRPVLQGRARKLIGPARRRRAVAMLRDRLGVSERWACRVVGQHRSTQRYEPTRAEDDQALTIPRYGLVDRPSWTGLAATHVSLRAPRRSSTSVNG